MKKIQFIISLFILTTLLSCSSDTNDVNLADVSTPTNISALMTVKQDNSGKVTILPRGEGVTRYEVYFGDGTVEPGYVNPGNATNHTYTEGVYQIKIVGMTVNGVKSEVIQELTVSFLPPTNLNVTIAPVPGNNMSITVKATANLETYFQVYFGETVGETPVNFMEGETITHTYANTGTYTIHVIALSGGAATAEYSEDVIISNPILLPVDFESATLNYAFTNFGGANTTVVANLNVGATNGSAKVAKLTKNAGSEVWAGSYLELGVPIDFSTMQ